MQTVMLKAERVHLHGNGIISIEMLDTPMSDSERYMLNRLFPNLQDRAYQLLDQEALLASLYTGPLPDANKYDTHETTNFEPKGRQFEGPAFKAKKL